MYGRDGSADTTLEALQLLHPDGLPVIDLTGPVASAQPQGNAAPVEQPQLRQEAADEGAGEGSSSPAGTRASNTATPLPQPSTPQAPRKLRQATLLSLTPRRSQQSAGAGAASTSAQQGPDNTASQGAPAATANPALGEHMQGSKRARHSEAGTATDADDEPGTRRVRVQQSADQSAGAGAEAGAHAQGAPVFDAEEDSTEWARGALQNLQGINLAALVKAVPWADQSVKRAPRHLLLLERRSLAPLSTIYTTQYIVACICRGRTIQAVAFNYVMLPAAAHQKGGSAEGYARWAGFKRHGLNAYSSNRNNCMRRNGVSRLSAYHHWGMVSPWRIAREATNIGALH